MKGTTIVLLIMFSAPAVGQLLYQAKNLRIGHVNKTTGHLKYGATLPSMQSFTVFDNDSCIRNVDCSRFKRVDSLSSFCVLGSTVWIWVAEEETRKNRRWMIMILRDDLECRFNLVFVLNSHIYYDFRISTITDLIPGAPIEIFNENPSPPVVALSPCQ
jgi:hypothetical protein